MSKLDNVELTLFDNAIMVGAGKRRRKTKRKKSSKRKSKRRKSSKRKSRRHR